MASKLEEARKIINEVDEQMAELFVKRMRAAEMVFEYKKEFGLPILDQKREEAVIEKNSALIEDTVLKEYYYSYIKNLMSISRAYQYRMQGGLKIAYSGVEGVFAHIATERIFPNSSKISCRDFKAAYDAVVCGESDEVVLPIENSYAGEVGQTIDLIFSGELYINGIYELEIHQDFLGNPTIGAMESLETAELYGLNVLEANINKSGENTTRFVVLSKVRAKSPEFCNSVLMFTVKNEAGALANAIGIISKYGYNITTLRSRPLKQHSWPYYFYIEIDGMVDDEYGRNMMDELDKVCDKLKVAGTFVPHVKI